MLHPFLVFLFSGSISVGCLQSHLLSPFLYLDYIILLLYKNVKRSYKQLINKVIHIPGADSSQQSNTCSPGSDHATSNTCSPGTGSRGIEHPFTSDGLPHDRTSVQNIRFTLLHTIMFHVKHIKGMRQGRQTTRTDKHKTRSETTCRAYPHALPLTLFPCIRFRWCSSIRCK